MHLRSTVLLAAALVAYIPPAIAQHEGHAGHALRISVDGSQTPDQIPDSLAYDHWFKAVAETNAPADQAAARQSAKLSPLTLSDTDRKTLIAALAAF